MSGWTFDGIAMFQEGLPLNLIAFPNTSNSFGGGLRPNVVAGCDKNISGSTVSKLAKYFNAACFTLPDVFTFGNESRTDNTIRSPGINN